MIKFFRKIRQNLVSTNKVGKYLLYAVGEIILVVIGILIALNINNKNEERKSAENTKLLFKQIAPSVMKSDLSKDVEMVTDFGSIIMRLSDETPKHRNNFIKLVNEKFYDGMLFHRVKENAIVQTGNHKTKDGYLQMKKDSVPLPNLIDSEFSPNLFHKRGALNAARQPDLFNPSRASSGSEFTIIQGNTYTDSTLNAAFMRNNKVRAKNNVLNRPEYKSDFDEFIRLFKQIQVINAYDTEISKAEEEALETAFMELKSKLESNNFDSLADNELKTMKKYSYPTSHREIYKTIGGAAHLDQNYTVFGEVVKGMEVVDSIASVETDKRDKPINAVKIISMRMIKRKSYN